MLDEISDMMLIEHLAFNMKHSSTVMLTGTKTRKIFWKTFRAISGQYILSNDADNTRKNTPAIPKLLDEATY